LLLSDDCPQIIKKFEKLKMLKEISGKKRYKKYIF